MAVPGILTASARSSLWQFLTSREVAGAFGGALATTGALALAPKEEVKNSFANEYQENLTFPVDINTRVDPYITFRFQKFEKRSIYDVSQLGNGPGSIRLPMPKNITDAHRVSYSEENIGAVVGSVAEEYVQRAQMLPLRRELEAGVAATQNVAAAFAVRSARNLTPDILDASSNIKGVAENPYQTFLFKSPTFKKHQFSWTFVPNQENETTILRSIIKMFQYHMLPGLSKNTGIFFTYPALLKVNFSARSEYHLYKFKPCVIESFTANYAPGASPAFYRSTGGPAAINCSMTLQEVELWTKQDFLQNASDPIRGVI